MGSGFSGVSSSSGPLGSFLSQTPSSGVYSALSSSGIGSATQTALRSGGMTQKEHDALVGIQGGGKAGLQIDWNKNGTEPSTLQTMRQNGWIKLVKPTDVSGTRGGVYTLTPVGQAIFKRAGGNNVNGSGGGSVQDSSGNGVSDQTKAQITAAFNAVQSMLGSMGSSSSSAGISTAAPGSSSSGTGSIVDTLA